MKIHQNESLLSTFLRAAQSGRVLHAYILEGPQGSGKMTLARYFAALLCCPSENKPCFSCRICRLIESGDFPDVMELRHEDISKQIRVEDVRIFIEEAYMTPVEADRRVFILENTQCMNAAGQNSLLKTFEEPPQGVTFILLTTEASALLPTIVSRGALLQTESLHEEVIFRALQERYPGKNAEELRFASLIAGGSLGFACDIATGGEVLALRQKTMHYLETLLGGKGMYDLLAAFPPAAVTRSELAVFFSFLTLGMRDILMYTSLRDVPEKLLFFDSPSSLIAVCRAFPPQRASALFDLVGEFTALLPKNINIFSCLCDFATRACALAQGKK